MSLATSGVAAFQQHTTISRLRSAVTARRASELQLNLGGNGESNQSLLPQLRQARSQASSSTRLAISLGKGAEKAKKAVIADNFQGRLKLGCLTFLRVVVPSILAGVAAFYAFPQLCLWLCSMFQDQGVFAVLSQDSSQFVQNFLSVSSLLFSILVGQTYYFMYQQQEMVYYALFDEVTEAKSLLEQVALVSQGRSMYKRVLECMYIYVESDLKALDKDPALLLSSRPMDDPLETIMYLVSCKRCNNRVQFVLIVFEIDSKCTNVMSCGVSLSFWSSPSSFSHQNFLSFLRLDFRWCPRSRLRHGSISSTGTCTTTGCSPAQAPIDSLDHALDSCRPRAHQFSSAGRGNPNDWRLQRPHGRGTALCRHDGRDRSDSAGRQGALAAHRWCLQRRWCSEGDGPWSGKGAGGASKGHDHQSPEGKLSVFQQQLIPKHKTRLFTNTRIEATS